MIIKKFIQDRKLNRWFEAALGPVNSRSDITSKALTKGKAIIGFLGPILAAAGIVTSTVLFGGLPLTSTAVAGLGIGGIGGSTLAGKILGHKNKEQKGSPPRREEPVYDGL